MNINFKVADVITLLVAVGELQRRGITVVMGPHRSFVTRSQVTKSLGRNPNFEHCNGAYWMSLTRWENGTKTVAPVDLGDPVPTSKSLNELPSVEDTIDVVREDAEANVPAVLTTPKESGAVERSAASQVEERTTLTASQTATADRQGWSVTLCPCRVACNSRVLGGSSSARLKWRVSQWGQRSPRRLRAISW